MTAPYPNATMSCAQAKEIELQIITCAEKMTNEEILNLADALHEVLRSRKRGKSTVAYLETRV